MHDGRNVAQTERYVSLGVGGALAFFAVKRRGMLGTAAASLAAELLYRGITGYCPIYGALGVDTGPRAGSYNPGASVPYGRGVRVDESIAVARSPRELYTYWRRLETLPQFMRHLEEVTMLTDTRSRWRVRAPVGSRISWEAEIINDVPNEMIGWRSLPGSAINHAGSVHFSEHGGATLVRVVLEYAPPARYFGASVARILGEEPQRQIAADLQRFKDIVERGEHANLQ